MESKLIYFKKSLLFSFVVLLSFTSEVAPKKILILAPSIGSHLMQMNSIAEGLIARGHEVHTILNSKAKVSKGILNTKIRVIPYDTSAEPVFQTKEYTDSSLAGELSNLGVLGRYKAMGRFFNLLFRECRGVLENNELLKKLANEKFDFVVNDGMMRCLYLIPYEIGVPFAVYMAFLPPDIPHAALQSPLILRNALDDLLFGDNAPPLLAKLGKVFFAAVFFNTAEVYDDVSNITLFEVQKRATLWLYDIDKVIDTPMALSPNVINVGGLNVRDPKPLPEGKLKQFVDSATGGFIYVSFGTIAKNIPKRIVNIFLDAFKEIPYKIVWKWDEKSLSADQVVPSNVLTMNWVPQNDVLGHKNIKLFVTHCGNSGQHEALYNSVPMVGFPLFADQMFNCKRIEGRFGRHIRARDLTKEKLVNLIKDVVVDRKYSENIRKASAVFRDHPMNPRETAAYWIDHVMKHGADHLLSRTNEMSWIRILMWDVCFAVFTIVVVLLSTLFLVCRCIFRRCCRGKGHKVKQS